MTAIGQAGGLTVDELVAQADQFAQGLATDLAAEPALRFQGMPSDGDSHRGYRALGEAGWIGIHWPERLGGRGLTALHTVACEERFGYHWLPLSGYLLSVKTIGNALLRFGSESLQESLIPEVAGGRVHVLSGLLRARRGLGPRVVADPCAPGRRPVRRERAQDLDLERRFRQLGVPRGANRS